MWGTRNIPQELGKTILFLIPKGNTDTKGVGLLKTLWKVLEAIIDTRLTYLIHFYDVLLRFRSGRGIGTATMDLKIAQYFPASSKTPFLSLPRPG